MLVGNPPTEDALANYLKMTKRQQVIALALGWSFRRIERETGVRRETVSRYSHACGQGVPG
jgi:DNA-binding NarL/FixJ family response regulator